MLHWRHAPQNERGASAPQHVNQKGLIVLVGDKKNHRLQLCHELSNDNGHTKQPGRSNVPVRADHMFYGGSGAVVCADHDFRTLHTYTHPVREQVACEISIQVTGDIVYTHACSCRLPLVCDWPHGLETRRFFLPCQIAY